MEVESAQFVKENTHPKQSMCRLFSQTTMLCAADQPTEKSRKTHSNFVNLYESVNILMFM